jgi:hypothetical protein
MKALDKGHLYEISSYDGYLRQEIRFMKREGVGYPGNFGKYAGTNCQELLRVLIDRIQYLDNQIECKENKKIIKKLSKSLLLLETRALKRHGNIDKLQTCTTCGHIACNHLSRHL